MTTRMLLFTALLVTSSVLYEAQAEDEDQDLSAAWDMFFMEKYGGNIMGVSDYGTGGESEVMGKKETEKRFSNFKTSFKQV